MYDKSDPRSGLANAAPKAAVIGAYTPAEIGRFYEDAPAISTPLFKTWMMRGQNMLVAHTEAQPGAVLERLGQVDEFVLLLPDRDKGATVEANGEKRTIDGFSIVMIPPGDSRITLSGGGRLTCIFTTQSADLNAKCANAASFGGAHARIPSLTPWPEPVGGYKLRAYSLDVPPQQGRFGRIFRCTTLMVNILDPQIGPRDVTKLSPHHHDDFEQGSLSLDGSFTHHMRWPWTPDMNDWREDEHPLVGSPSLTVIPPPAIHTSRGMDDGLNQLVDIFAPPREDFSNLAGWVLNADDYPMPKRA